MKKHWYLGAGLAALAAQPVLAQAGPPVVVVQLYYTGLNMAHIAITRGVGKTEDVEFKNAEAKTHTAAEAYQRVFAQLSQEGYSLKSTFSLATPAVVTLVFEKK